ncbi:MAG: cysteine desulfurase family protein [Anaerovoracaceae bacterium]|jgi:cysteine desulfurase
MFVYLDNSATTKPYKEVIKETVKYMEEDFGNPSSLHRMGIASEKGLKNARRIVADSLGAKEDEIVFTSGGTEGDNLALFGAALGRKRLGNKIITTKIEHPAVLESCRQLVDMGYEVVSINVDKTGIIKLSELESAIGKDTILISVMHVNNETGSIQPLDEINKIRRDAEKKLGKEILLHTDAVQSYGKIPVNVKDLDVDFAVISGHKIHGPKGVGALYIRKGVHIPPMIYGGGQERSMRSGTENVTGIVGLGIAAEINHQHMKKRQQVMHQAKNYLRDGILRNIPDIKINSPEDGSPSILNVSFIGIRGEVLLHTLEQDNIYVSTGSACSSKNKKKSSHVLKAQNLSDKEIEGAIRFSFSEFNTIEEMDYVLDCLKAAVNKIRRLGSFR